MDGIADSIDSTGCKAWQDCFSLCGEDEICAKLKAAPTNPDATPEFSGLGIAVASAAHEAKAESGGSAIAAIVDVVKAPGDQKAKADSSVPGIAAVVAYAKTPGNQKATAVSSCPAIAAIADKAAATLPNIVCKNLSS